MLTVTSNAAVTLSALKNGASTVNSANYTFANNILTIKATYLATLTDGVKTFTLDFAEADDVSVAVTVVTGNVVDDATETFSKAAPADVVFVITPDTGAEFSALKIGEATLSAFNYTYVNGTLTITGNYLAMFENGDVVFTAVMSAYNDIDLTITVVTGNTVDDATESFSRAASADVVFVITPEGEATLSALKIGETAVDAANYTYVDGTLTIKATYLATLENGDVVFTAVMSAYNDIDLTITVAA